jgi:hypothetical protein
VGKSVVGWQVYSNLVAAGKDCAFVDIDQVGICYPPPAADRDRYQLKADNLAGTVAGFSQAGARGVIVAGVVDAQRGPRLERQLAERVTLCRLRADPDRLLERLSERPGPVAVPDEVLEEAQTLDQTTFADWCVDTSGLSVQAVARQVLEDLADWPGSCPRSLGREPEPTLDAASGDLLWLCGPTGVGKSTISFQAYRELLAEGVTAAYVDVDQIGHCSTAVDDHRLRARNLGRLWARFRRAGAQALVTVGPISATTSWLYEQALPSARFTWVELAAGRHHLTRRLLTRQAGGSWAQPGDPLRGRSTREILKVAETAAAQPPALQIGTSTRIDTDTLTVTDAAHAVLAVWDHTN